MNTSELNYLKFKTATTSNAKQALKYKHRICEVLSCSRARPAQCTDISYTPPPTPKRAEQETPVKPLMKAELDLSPDSSLVRVNFIEPHPPRMRAYATKTSGAE